MKKIYLYIALLFLSFTTFAQQQAKTVVHTVESGQTIFSIAKAYQLSTEDILRSNPGLDGSFVIKPGQALVIDLPHIAPASTTSQQLMKNSVDHNVLSGDTLYSLAKYYNVSIEDLKKWNNISGNTIKEGQNLIVGYNYSNKFSESDDNLTVTNHEPMQQVSKNTIKSTESVNVPQTQVPVNAPVVNDEVATKSNVESNTAVPKPVARPTRTLSKQEKLQNKFNQQKNISGLTNSEGTAIWIVSKNRMMNATYYGMFSDVPVGTVVKVQNLNNNRSVYVKVIGSLPNTKENTGALIKLTPAVKKALKTSDAKVRVKVFYAK